MDGLGEVGLDWNRLMGLLMASGNGLGIGEEFWLEEGMILAVEVRLFTQIYKSRKSKSWCIIATKGAISNVNSISLIYQ